MTDGPELRVIMSLSQQFATQLTQLVASPMPTTASVSDADVSIDLDLTTVDSLSCSFSEMRIGAASLQAADINDLKVWAEALSQRVTYLLENIGPIEIDPTANQVLIRSTPPNQRSGRTRFYEMVLKAHSNGSFSLRRYESEKGTPGRTPVDIATTHEVLLTLIDDLIDTIP